uniref:Uncharacterized protein n=1 Tax=Dicentrarchus labrax TaxID=13489 RepID=A0A8C4HL82_DICLA
MCRPEDRIGWLGVCLGFALFVVVPVLIWERVQTTERTGNTPKDMLRTGPVTHTHSHTPTHLNRSRRSLPVQYDKHKDKCLARYGGIELNYTLGSISTYQFDLCNVINCGGRNEEWIGYDTYLCGFPWFGTKSITWCERWSNVIASSSTTWQPLGRIYMGIDLPTKIKYRRRQGNKGGNPVHLSLLGFNTNPWIDQIWTMAECGSFSNSAYLVVGIDQSGADTMALIKINFLRSPTPIYLSTSSSAATAKPNITLVTLNEQGLVDIHVKTPLSPAESIAVATGYTDRNEWLGWIAATAASLKMTTCIACSTARPILITVPAPLHAVADPAGFHCMLALTMQKVPVNCGNLSEVYPAVTNHTIPPVFTPKEGNYTCFTRNTGPPIGEIDPSWCNHMINITTWTNATDMVWARADLFWYCGQNTIRPQLPANWRGTCALVRLAMPLTLFGAYDKHVTPRRPRRSVKTDAFDFSSETYIDVIGIPRGIPDCYKLADPIASGFENLPLICSFPSHS